MTVLLVGSGPSLDAADIEAARSAGWRIIACNDNWIFDPDVFYAPDWQWIDHPSNAGCWRHPNRWTVYQRKRAPRYLKAGWQLLELTQSHVPGLRREPPLISGGNAGHQMLGLALYLFAPRRIVLTGYDMQPTGHKPRWRGEHPAGVEKHEDGKYVHWRDRLATTVEPLREMGVEVVNATRVTALDCFPRVALESLL